MKQTMAALSLLTALLCAPSAALAGFGYTYVDVGYRYVDGPVNDGGGIAAGLSAAIRRDVHVFAGYNQIDASDGFKMGVGVKGSVDRNLDLVGRLAWVDIDQDNGLQLELGFRAWAAAMELNAGIFLAALDSDEETGGYIGAVIPLRGALGLTADLSFSNNYTTVGVGFRAYF